MLSPGFSLTSGSAPAADYRFGHWSFVRFQLLTDHRFSRASCSSLMSVPRPAIEVATVTAPFLPASEMIQDSLVAVVAFKRL